MEAGGLAILDAFAVVLKERLDLGKAAAAPASVRWHLTWIVSWMCNGRPRAICRWIGAFATWTAFVKALVCYGAVGEQQGLIGVSPTSLPSIGLNNSSSCEPQKPGNTDADLSWRRVPVVIDHSPQVRLNAKHARLTLGDCGQAAVTLNRVGLDDVGTAGTRKGVRAISFAPRLRASSSTSKALKRGWLSRPAWHFFHFMP